MLSTQYVSYREFVRFKIQKYVFIDISIVFTKDRLKK